MSIYYPVIFVSALYYAIGYFINEENSKYLLSGYNTMSDQERKNFDKENYLTFFKSFFKQQSLISFLIFQISYLIFKVEESLIFWSIYITIAIVYLVVKSQKFNKKPPLIKWVEETELVNTSCITRKQSAVKQSTSGSLFYNL